MSRSNAHPTTTAHPAHGPLAVGLVGAGGIAQSYLQVFRTLTDARLVAVADVRADLASSFAEAARCRSHTSPEAMARAEELDAVLICTPPDSHAAIATMFLEQGVAVLCEKPLALAVADAEAMLATAEAAGVVLTMGAKFRYVDDVVRAKSIVASGILGEIILFENVFASRADMSQRWNSDPARSGGGVLIDNGTHSVDIVRYFLGPVTEVLAVEGKRVQGLAVEDTVQMFVRAASGARGTIDLSWSIDKERDSYIEIYGSQGTVRVGWRQSRYRQATSADWVVFGSGYSKIDCMRAQVENFCRAVRGTEALRITAADALASVAVIDKAYASLGRSRWARVSGAAANGRGHERSAAVARLAGR
ncbi:MAG: Gfo/Idh/MocA family protein [Acidimicrobiales bacterium]